MKRCVSNDYLCDVCTLWVEEVDCLVLVMQRYSLYTHANHLIKPPSHPHSYT